MKKVFTNSSEVMHIFAQQGQSEGRSSNVFFYGDKIYSYGYHYLLAEFKTVNNEQFIVINDSGHSNTTAKHISEIKQATRQYKQFFETEINPVKVRHELESLAQKLQSARKKELYILPAERLFSKYTEYQNFAGLTNDIENNLQILKLIECFRGKSYTDYLAERAKIIKLAEKKRLSEAKKKFKKELKDFFEYKINRVYSNVGEDFCRISQDGKSIETTQYVRVSIESAKVLYSLIKAGKDIKGFVIDGYTVISINGTLKIGCHHINTKNVKEIGEKILSM